MASRPIGRPRRVRVAACLLACGVSASPAWAQTTTGAGEVAQPVCDGIRSLPYVLPSVLAPLQPALAGLSPVRTTLLRGTVVTMDDAHSVLAAGNVLVTGERISAIWSGNTVPQDVDLSTAKIVDVGPDGLIFPGLINLHDHPSYDALPVVPPPASHAQPAQGRPTGTEPYANRYQWNRQGPTTSPDFRRLVVNAQDALTSSSGLGLYVDVVKHAEARAILGGQTALQGASGDPAFEGLLVRNVDGQNFGRDKVESRVPDVNEPEFAVAAGDLKARMAAGQIDAWLVHLAEGVRDGQRRQGDTISSRQELDRIRDLGVLTDAAVVLHGVGLEKADFAAMRAAPPAGVGDGLGAKLVWSPLSNLLLYGTTTEIYDALAEDVLVALGTDWTPSGSNTLLEELKVADIALRDTRVLGDTRALVPALADDLAVDRALVDMVTRNPAKMLRWDEVGSVALGKVADLLVLRRPATAPTGGMPDSPYRSLIDATGKDVALVLVGGEPLAGDLPVVSSLRGSDFEVVTSPTGKYSKAIDVTVPQLPMGEQRLVDIEQRVSTGLRALGGDGATAGSGPPPTNATFSYLRQNFACGRHLLDSEAAFRDQVLTPRFGTVDGRVNLERIEIVPLLAHDDDFFFVVTGGVVDPATGLPADNTPPFRLYLANSNQTALLGNPYARPAFRDRWYAG